MVRSLPSRAGDDAENRVKLVATQSVFLKVKKKLCLTSFLEIPRHGFRIMPQAQTDPYLLRKQGIPSHQADL